MSSVAKVVLVLLALWVFIGILGLIIKGLFWLFILGCVAFGVTALAGSARRRGILNRR
jgi:hypothetical protein